MRFGIKKGKVRILEPFALFGIIIGAGINLVVPLISTDIHITFARKTEIYKTIWFVAALCGFTYTLFLLKYLFQKGALDRLLYFIMIAIFLVLMIFTIYLP